MNGTVETKTDFENPANGIVTSLYHGKDNMKQEGHDGPVTLT